MCSFLLKITKIFIYFINQFYWWSSAMGQWHQICLLQANQYKFDNFFFFFGEKIDNSLNAM